MELSNAIHALSALGQEHRLAAYRFLVRRGCTGATVGEIRGSIGLPAATLSHHLGQLRESGLVRVQREGRSIRYHADAEAIRSLSEFLEAECCADDRPEASVEEP
jgi:ArsR family transcriptional regulator, arsenate/arsenite/antimonite-responsive transcriptional repressor